MSKDNFIEFVQSYFGVTPPNFWFFIISLLIAVAATLLIQNFKTRIVTSIEIAKNKLVGDNTVLLETIESYLSPRIVHCSTEVEVVDEARSMLELAISANNNIPHEPEQKENRNGLDEDLRQRSILGSSQKSTSSDKDDLDEEPFITFYGAADLSTPMYETADETQREVFSKFGELLESAIENGVRVRRYINLFPKDELEKRTLNAKEQYLRWLIQRYDFVANHNTFVLVDHPRVPQWGASFSSLLTNDAVLEIKANGLAGIAIYHKEISENIRKSLRRAREQADSKRIRRISKSNQSELKYFFKYIIDVADWCDLNIKKSTGKGKSKRFEYFTVGGSFHDALAKEK